MKALSLGLGAVGIMIPLFVLILDTLSGIGYPSWTPFAWPSMILLLPYGGIPFDAEKVGVAIVSIALNGALYSVVGLVIGAISAKLREK